MIKKNHTNLHSNVVSQNVEQTEVNKPINKFLDPRYSIYWFDIYTTLDSLQINIDNHVERIESKFEYCEDEDLLKLKEDVVGKLLQSTVNSFDDLRLIAKSKHENLKYMELSKMSIENN